MNASYVTNSVSSIYGMFYERNKKTIILFHLHCWGTVYELLELLKEVREALCIFA